MKRSIAFIKIALLTAFFLLLIFSSKAQVIQEVQNSFNLYRQTTLQEKIFVHTDKDVYLPGEIIWFKIYCVDGDNNKLLNLSKIAYVEIIDNNQNPVIQTKVSINNGLGSGSVYMPVTIANGFYKFRTYTNWMKNFNPDFYFEKKLTLINPLRPPENTDKITTSASNTFDVQFFPEGGNLVVGLTSKVAFKVTGISGSGMAATGAVVDQRNDTVAKFNTLKFGMGNFSFTPAANQSYKAIIKVGIGKAITKELPQVASQGCVMSLTDKGAGKLEITVNSTSNPEGNVYLFAHTRQQVKAAANTTMLNGTARFSVDKKALGEGISHITIFNDNKQPVCERLYFKKPEQQLFIDAGTDQQQYDLRKKVTVSIAANTKAGQPLNANLSMAVYRVDSLQGVDHNNIVNYLWLSSELKGGIESPEYYFENANPETAEALDNLMLTQGWSRFKWSALLENKSPLFAYAPEYYGHLIIGRVINTVTNAPAKNILTYLGIPGKRVQLYTSRSDSSGNVLYVAKSFYGANELIVQTNQLVDSTYRIDIATPFSDQYSKDLLPAFKFNENTLKDLQAHSLGAQVLNIYSSTNLKRFYEPLVDSSAFYGQPSATYKLDDFVRFRTMEEDLREYVKEDNIVKSKGKFHIKVLTHRGFLDGGDPLVLLDGVPIFNIDKVIAIDPLKVRKLEVMATPYFYGPSEEQGIFSFTTYKGDLGGVDLDPHAVVLDYEGLQFQREFYSPVYDTPAQAASRIPDFRNLLYWSPSVTSQGKGTVSFYTSEQPGKYVGVIQGVSVKGDAGSRYFTFDVK